MMDHCPHCGVELEARLVAAIRNPSMSESCPSKHGKAAPAKAPNPVNRLASFMLAAHIMREAMEASK